MTGKKVLDLNLEKLRKECLNAIQDLREQGFSLLRNERIAAGLIEDLHKMNFDKANNEYARDYWELYLLCSLSVATHTMNLYYRIDEPEIKDILEDLEARMMERINKPHELAAGGV